MIVIAKRPLANSIRKCCRFGNASVNSFWNAILKLILEIPLWNSFSEGCCESYCEMPLVNLFWKFCCGNHVCHCKYHFGSDIAELYLEMLPWQSLEVWFKFCNCHCETGSGNAVSKIILEVFHFWYKILYFGTKIYYPLLSCKIRHLVKNII